MLLPACECGILGSVYSYAKSIFVNENSVLFFSNVRTQQPGSYTENFLDRQRYHENFKKRDFSKMGGNSSMYLHSKFFDVYNDANYFELTIKKSEFFTFISFVVPLINNEGDIEVIAEVLMNNCRF